MRTTSRSSPTAGDGRGRRADPHQHPAHRRGGRIGRSAGRRPRGCERVLDLRPRAARSGVDRFRDEANALFDIDIIARASADLVLDLTFNERSLAVAAATLAWLVDTLHGGDDVDVIVHDPIQGNDLGDAADVPGEPLQPRDERRHP